MIITQFTGGLGNQMFQYALGRRLSMIHSVELKFDLSSYQNDELRHFILDCFNIVGDSVSASDLAHYSKSNVFGLNNHILNALVRWKLTSGPVIVTDTPAGKDPLMVFNEQVLASPRNTYLRGYWQSEKYFLPIRQTLCADFSLREEMDDVNKKMLKQVRSCTAVSIHVRRGDYVNNPMTNHSHGTCGLDYYYDAILHIVAKISEPHFFVFSDDVTWAKANLKIRFPTKFVTLNNGDKSFWDMELMRHCKHHIIANSSFSWWGAWLNEYSEKIVVAPKKWFNNFNADTRDLIPDSWQRI